MHLQSLSEYEAVHTPESMPQEQLPPRPSGPAIIPSGVSYDGTRSAVLETESNAPEQDEEHHDPKSGIDSLVDATTDSYSTWRPFWVQPAILAGFTGLFFIVAAALVALSVYSHRNDGLASARDNLRYLWRFGPTACTISLIKSVSR